jgi:mRNA interferase MazF
MSREAARPALILSPRVYNSKPRLALAYPITSQSKGYPFELAIPPGQSVAGVVLADYIKNLNWRVRKAAFESKAPAGVVAEVRERLMPLLGF